MFDILDAVTPLIEPLSLDEAFLDVTASRALFGAPAEIARASCAGASPTRSACPPRRASPAVKFVAKIASDLAKPNGQLEVPPDGGAAFLAPLPVAGCGASGPKTAGAGCTSWASDRRRHRRARPAPGWSGGSAPAAATWGS